MNIAAGCRVVRGPDWKWSEQDGGEGHIGTVVVVGKSRSVSSPEKTVVVQWDGGTRTNYRCGYQNAYDLRLFDNGPAGVRHRDVSCSQCKTQNIEGMLWQCQDCPGCTLCTPCYMSDKHGLDHEFSRCEAPGKPSISVGQRLGQSKVEAKGTFPGAKVMRGPDWDWGNQDGGLGNVGVVTDVRGWEHESYRSVVSVKWKEATTNVYRLGHKGKVDVTCIVFSSGGSYYKDHLPNLGQTLVSAGTPGRTAVSSTPPFETGDQVRVLLPVPTLKALQDGHGGWHSKMEEVIGLIGTVHRITDKGDVRVRYSTQTNRWTFNPEALVKYHDFHVGDKARVLSSEGIVKKLQFGHGEWAPEMTKALGKVGKVFDIYADGDIRLSVAGKFWTFNPAALIRESAEMPLSSAPISGQQPQIQQQGRQHQQTPQQTPHQGHTTDSSLSLLLEQLRLRSSSDVAAKLVSLAGQGLMPQVKKLLSMQPDLISKERCGWTALQLSSYRGYTDTVRALLESGADPKQQDEDGATALHYAASGNHVPVVTTLMEGGADCNQGNKNKWTPVHVAVNKGHVDVVRALLAGRCDVNLQNSLGESPLFDAVGQNLTEMVRLLVNAPGAKFNLKNKRGFNALHQCTLKGNGTAASLILGKVPGLANSKGDDSFASLHLAALNGHYSVARALVEARCDVNIRNSRMKTPLLLAVEKSHSSSVPLLELLLDSRADVNSQDDVGSTPLHVLVTYHSLKHGETSGQRQQPTPDETTFAIARLLLQRGGDVMLRNQHGKTALQLCRDPRLTAVLQGQATQHSGPVPSPPVSSVSPTQSTTTVKCRTCDSVADSRFEPCGHVLACYSCAPFFKKCFQCKAVVESVTKIQECVMCSDAHASVTFLPCGHRVACEVCAVRMKKCIACKVRITQTTSGTATAGRGDTDSDAMQSMQSLLSLQSRMREMEEATKCDICLDNQRNVVFLCGHGTCADCARALDTCPMCRKPITKKIPLFI